MTTPYGVKTLDENEAAVYITGPNGKIIGHTGIARFCKTAEEANAVTQANADMARRIAACLNACEGIPTDYLEGPEADGQEIARKGYAEITGLRTQRDQLLAAAEFFKDIIDTLRETGKRKADVHSPEQWDKHVAVITAAKAGA